jgi:hypothetical protein
MKNKIDKNSDEYKAKKRAYAKEYRNKNPDKIKANNIKFGKKKKVDRKINPEKYSLENKKYYENNKEVIKLKEKEYKINNPEKVRATKQKWFEKNRKQANQASSNWSKNNKEKVNAQRRQKRKEDILFKLKGNLRTLLGNAFRRNGFSKSGKTQELLGTSFNELKMHLESLFEPWMNWNNYGLYNGAINYGWDIDHIISLSTANSEDSMKQLNHYKNLQPLCSFTNRVLKRDK